MTIPVLSDVLLSELHERWVAAGAPIAQRLRPGLSERRMSELMEPIGRTLPYEARLWWGWHDGAERAAPGEDRAARLVGPPFPFLSLEEALADYFRWRETVRTVVRGEAEPGRVEEWVDRWWPPHLLPLTHNVGALVCDLDTPDGAGTPVRWMEPSALHEGAPTPLARSLGEIVTWWIEAFDRGIWSYDADRTQWQRDYSLLRPEERLRPL